MLSSNNRKLPVQYDGDETLEGTAIEAGSSAEVGAAEE